MLARTLRPLVAIAAGALACGAAACGGSSARPGKPAITPLQSFPTASSVGVPAGWRPKQTRTTDLVVRKAGAIVEDVLLVDADLVVDAPNVTIRRVELQGGRIQNHPRATCGNGMLVEDTTIEPRAGERYAQDSEGVVSYGGYTARRVKIWRREEGFRAGERSSGCGPVLIEDSFVKIAIPPGCPGDPHADGIQGFDGPPLTVRNTTIDFTEAACGTAPFFVPESQGNTSVDVDGLLVMGGGATFRDGVPGQVRGLRIVDKSWSYRPVDVQCQLLRGWDAKLVTISRGYRVMSTRGRQPCL
jgi:hypothetical protein